MPNMQIIPRADGAELRLESTDAPLDLETEEKRTARLMQDRENERQAERYGNLVARPLAGESVMTMTEETRQRLESSDREKASVGNVVTTHSDVAKVTGEDGVALVPTVNVYTKETPTEGPKLEITDPTVIGGKGVGFTDLDRAESTLKQPQGDEYSAKAATGPELPEGHTVGAKGTTKPAAKEGATAADLQKQREEEGQKAAEEAAKLDEKVRKEQEKQAEGQKAEIPSTEPEKSSSKGSKKG